MNQLIDTMASRIGASRKAASMGIGNMSSAIAVVLAEHGECRIPGLGTLRVVTRAARKGRNPRTGAVIDIPARKVVTFRPARGIKAAIR